MKIIVNGPGGLFENVTQLVGYQDLCLLVLEDPELAGDIFDAVGSRLARYYERAAEYESVGALIANDDWGFRFQVQFMFPK